MSLTVRLATKEDAKLIADISQETFYHAFAADNTKEDMDQFLNEQFTKGKLMLEVGTPENIFYLAYEGDKIAGYVKLRDARKPNSLGDANALEIARLYALPEFIGKGVGSLLMQVCVDVAKEKQKEILWLGVWEKNERALAFYERWGFKKFGDTEFLLGGDLQRDWLMRKDVG